MKDRYREAVNRNLDGQINKCLRELACFKEGLSARASNLLPLSQYSLETFKCRMGVRSEDKSEDPRVANLSAATFATRVTLLNRYLEQGGSVVIHDRGREWLGAEPFTSMDGGLRMSWLRFAEDGWKHLDTRGRNLVITCQAPASPKEYL